VVQPSSRKFYRCSLKVYRCSLNQLVLSGGLSFSLL